MIFNDCKLNCRRFITTPSVGVARALGLRRWIEYEDTISDVDRIFIYGDQGMILENSHST